MTNSVDIFHDSCYLEGVKGTSQLTCMVELQRIFHSPNPFLHLAQMVLCNDATFFC